MTGGREGSNILASNEVKWVHNIIKYNVERPAWLQVLQYPSLFATTGTGLGFTLKRWQWANEKAKNTDVSCRAQSGAWTY